MNKGSSYADHPGWNVQRPYNLKKRELIRALNAEIVGVTGTGEASINVIIDEIEKENWVAGGELYADKFPD